MTADTITLLESAGDVLLTKVWNPDGVRAYDRAKNFRPQSVPVAGLTDLHRVLTGVQQHYHACAIRGVFVGDGALPAGWVPEIPGYVQRTRELFADRPHHWVCFDVDAYQPEGISPAGDPEGAILQFVARCLPKAFAEVSFVWQLSASAGQPGKEGVLKAHVWFWLAEAYGSDTLKQWSKSATTAVDRTLFNPVQIHYTAAPKFEGGARDPVARRSGLWEGLAGDEVPLHLDAQILAAEVHARTSAGEVDLVDPREKPGLIGAFHRAFDFNACHERWLHDVIELTGDPDHLTYRLGGGTPGGMFLTGPGDLYVGNNHNSDPHDNRAVILWDMVRQHLFGDLDEDADAFQMLSPADWPSQQAMWEMVRQLPEIVEQGEAETEEATRGYREALAGAPDVEALKAICRTVALDRDLDALDRVNLIEPLRERNTALSGGRINKSLAEQMLGMDRASAEARRQAAVAEARDGEAPAARRPPGVMADLFFVTGLDSYVSASTGERYTKLSFGVKFDPVVAGLPGLGGADGTIPTAWFLASMVWRLPVVARTVYMPQGPQIVEWKGLRCLNVYSARGIPPVPGVLSTRDLADIETARGHLARICGGRQELTEWLIQYLAHNVQYPGRKIRFAPAIKGIEGDGKTAIGRMLEGAMGSNNVTLVSGAVLRSEFNGWAEGAAVGVLEELKIPGHRLDVMESLKEIITNDKIPIHRKGRDGYDAPNSINLLAFTNHEDALPIISTDRRWTIIFAPWASLDELLAALPCRGADYFDQLYAAAANAPAMRAWLMGVDLAGFRPNGRAFGTDEKDEVTAANDGEGLLREVLGAVIDDGAPGVTANVVDQAALTDLVLEGIREAQGQARAPIRIHLGKPLKALGYEAFKPVKWNGKTRRIWVKTRAGGWTQEEVRAELDGSSGTADADFR